MEESKLSELLSNRKKKLIDAKKIKEKYPNDNQVQIIADATISDLKYVISMLESVDTES